MASRLYRTTRPLFAQVVLALEALRVPLAVGSNPTTFGLVALYVTGLALLDARPTQRRISAALPARGHDALNRLLRTAPLSTRALLRGLLGFVGGLSRRLGTAGYLCVDDVVLEKPFAKRLPWASWTYSFSKKRKVYGVHVVLLLWSSDPAGAWRVPVAFRLWRPKRTAAPGRYQKKTQLVVTMLREVVAAGCPAAYLVGDTSYTGGGVRAAAERLGLVWVGTLAPRTTVVWRGHRQPVQALAATLKLKWRPQLGVRARALSVYAPSLGQVRLVVLKNAHGNYEYLVTNDAGADLTTLVQRKREPLADRNDLPRHQATGRVGGLSVLGRSGAGAACRARLPDLRRAAAAPPRPARHRGCGQRLLAGRGAARRPSPAATPAGRPARLPRQVTA